MNPQETQMTPEDTRAALGFSNNILMQMLPKDAPQEMEQGTNEETPPETPSTPTKSPKNEMAGMEKRIMGEIESLRKEIEDNSPKEALSAMQDEIKKFLEDDTENDTETEKD